MHLSSMGRLAMAQFISLFAKSLRFPQTHSYLASVPSARSQLLCITALVWIYSRIIGQMAPETRLMVVRLPSLEVCKGTTPPLPTNAVRTSKELTDLLQSPVLVPAFLLWPEEMPRMKLLGITFLRTLDMVDGDGGGLRCPVSTGKRPPIQRRKTYH